MLPKFQLRLLRVGLWLHIKQAPPHADGITRIPALPHRTRAILAEHRALGRWENLLEEAEGQSVQYRMHLDLQGHVALALRELGTSFEAGLRAVEVEVHSLISRVPQLLDLKAADGVPLANAETRAWVNSLEPYPRDAKATTPAEPRHMATQPLPVAPVSDGLNRYRETLQRAEQAEVDGQKSVALALFHSLYKQLCRKRLVDWDTSLSMRVLEGLLRSLQRTSRDAELETAVFEKIARIDPDAAIRIGQNSDIAS